MFVPLLLSLDVFCFLFPSRSSTSAVPPSFDLDMKGMNKTFLLSLLSRCQRIILEDTDTNIIRHQNNSTTVSPLSSTTPMSTISNARKTYDNAYFYILFVMIFYSFLAMALFNCSLRNKQETKDPYEEFISPGLPSTQKFNTGHMAETFYFEEESSLWATGFL